MLSAAEANAIIDKTFPGAQVRGPVDDGTDYIYLVFQDDDDEAGFDPYVAVDKASGVWRGYVIFREGTPEVVRQFEELLKEGS